jgi:8-oxo-dGTP diphosphatase
VRHWKGIRAVAGLRSCGDPRRCRGTVRSKLEYTTLAASFVEEPFTLADLRRVYAAVWGVAPDLGNFRRKVLGTDGFVTEAQRSREAAAGPAGGRPPLLYWRGSAVILHPPMLRPQAETHRD